MADASEYYDFVLTPMNAPEENKSGITFKGRDDEYKKAHQVIMDLTGNKGDRFVINGVEISIADAAYNKPMSIAVKPKNGLTGKANLKIYAINKAGFGTFMVTKPSGGDMIQVRSLAFHVVKYLLDGIISGDIDEEDIEKMRKKVVTKPGKKKTDHKCDLCEDSFTTIQGLKIHTTRIH